LLASTGECTAEHIAGARMVLLATKLCDQRPPSTRRHLVRKTAQRWQYRNS
jgi:hypothetical protein